MTRLMSFCVMAIVAAMKAVKAPIVAITHIAVCDCSTIGWARAIR